MKDEIKEILEDLKNYANEGGEHTLMEYEIKHIQCYITNLQDKYKEADYDRHKLFEENQNLKQINEEHRKINGELREIINKAIEYVENENTDRFNNPTYEFALELRKNKLLNILQGKSDE